MLAGFDGAILLYREDGDGFVQGFPARPPRVRSISTLTARGVLGDESVTVCRDQAAAVIKEFEVVGHHGAEGGGVAPLHEQLEETGVRCNDLGSQVRATCCHGRGRAHRQTERDKACNKRLDFRAHETLLQNGRVDSSPVRRRQHNCRRRSCVAMGLGKWRR